MPRLVWVRAGEATFRERLEIADPSVLDLFNLPVLEGNRETIFQAPYSLLVTASMSKRWFGDESPIWKTVFIESKISGGDYTITGLIEDFPPNSTYHFRFVTNSRVGNESAKTPGVTAQGSRVWRANATWGGLPDSSSALA